MFESCLISQVGTGSRSQLVAGEFLVILATSSVPTALIDAGGTSVMILLCQYLSGRVVLVAFSLFARWCNTLPMLAVLSRKCSPEELHMAFKESCVCRLLF